MRVLISIFVIIYLMDMMSSCSGRYRGREVAWEARELMGAGSLSRLIELSGTPEWQGDFDPLHRREIDSLVDRAGRYLREFPHTDEAIVSLLAADGVDAGPEDIRSWEEKGYLEFMLIDGEKRYFRWAHRNLYRIDDSLREIKQIDRQRDESLASFCMEEIDRILAASAGQTSGSPVRPRSFRITYTISVEAGAVPAGETIRCWMPYPREDIPRQDMVRLVSATPGDYLVAPDSFKQRTIYFEQRAVDGEPAVFSAEIEFRSHSQYFDPSLLRGPALQALPEKVKEYTAERLPHIAFSEDIVQLSGILVRDTMTPFEKAEAYYRWINDNIIWTSAVEYGLVDDIPAYVLRNGRGDCGMQTLLFLSLCRYSGIPARWQSGWMMHKGHVNLHDWSEIWIDQFGWVPVDVSFKLQPSDRLEKRDFYMSGMDSYRLTVNNDYGMALYPARTHPRSEPVDFQRGELEWEGGNLYFDKWRYRMEVSYLNDD